jgi:uncharacterized membrane protein
MDELTKKVARHIADRKHIARNTAKEFDTKTTLGQRAADAVATFGGGLGRSYRSLLQFCSSGLG